MVAGSYCLAEPLHYKTTIRLQIMILFRKIVQTIADDRNTRYVVTIVVALHTVLLAYSAAIHSPTIDEPAHLASGLSHLRTGDLRPYCVNPPLPRLIGALAVTLSTTDRLGRLDLSADRTENDIRPEWAMADLLIERCQGDIFQLVTVARWGCIPFSICGAVVCFLWARSLYGRSSAYFALTLWCFLPEILGHGALVTPDVPAAAMGACAGYTFWKYLRCHTLTAAGWAGICLGLALLTKTTWIILFVLWPVLWIVSVLSRHVDVRLKQKTLGLVIVIGCGGLMLNGGYLFQGTFRPLGSMEFFSNCLAGNRGDLATIGKSGNRFSGTILHSIPLFLPEVYVAGIDLQKKDFEEWRPVYLAGDMHPDGLWYFYLYAAFVKLPLGFIVLLGMRLLTLKPSFPTQAEALLWLVPSVLFVLASSLGSLAYFRYLMPIWPYLIIWVSGLAVEIGKRSKLAQVAIVGPAAWIVLSSLSVFPHSLSYFNEATGGPRNGHAYLIDSQIDWGQDLLLLKKWSDTHPHQEPLNVAYYGIVSPAIAGIDFQFPSFTEFRNSGPPTQITPGWYAISVHFLHGGTGRTFDQRHLERKIPEELLRRHPIDRVGYSILIYKIP